MKHDGRTAIYPVSEVFHKGKWIINEEYLKELWREKND